MIARKRQCLIGSLAGALCLVEAGSTQANIITVTTTFSDTIFSPSNWTTVIQTDPPGGSATITQGSNASSGTYRQVSLSLNSAYGTQADGEIYAFSFYTSHVFDPAVSGHISSLTFTEGVYTGAAAQEMGPAIYLDGKCYYGFGAQTAKSGVWQTVSLTPSLSLFKDYQGNSAPNLSTVNDPIEFGFVAINTTGVGGLSSNNFVEDYDNWSVGITSLESVPEPIALLPAIALLPLLRRRRHLTTGRSPV